MSELEPTKILFIDIDYTTIVTDRNISSQLSKNSS